MTARMLEVSRDIGAPVEAAWRLLVDTATWPQWGITVRGLESTDRCMRLGSRGRVRTVGGLWVPFEVTSFEDGRAWTWYVGGIASIGHRVVPTSTGRCRVTFELPWLAWPYAVVCRLALRRIARMLEVRT
ncbi:MAG: SRPBCC family protein [Kofleriaceae bacterium]|nr:SRPBCC family protein [Kofleriaceae bacterium]